MEAAKDTTNIAVLEAFVVRYNDTFYAELARVRIREVEADAGMPAPAVNRTPSRLGVMRMVRARRCWRGSPASGETSGGAARPGMTSALIGLG